MKILAAALVALSVPLIAAAGLDSSTLPPACDQETSTSGNWVTYAAGALGCTPETVTYARAAAPIRLPHCPQEDSRGCLWDAGSDGLGNGGHSFWTTRADRVYYINFSRLHAVTQELADALAEGHDAPNYKWERCYYTHTYSRTIRLSVHKTMLLACPSGFSEVN